MSAEPSVSPANTIRHVTAELRTRGEVGLAELLEQATAALLDVGERDKAERDRQQKRAERAEQVLREQVAENRTLVVAGARDRRRIAQLTEALEQIAANLTIASREGVWDPSAAKRIARAVLAVEEDATK